MLVQYLPRLRAFLRAQIDAEQRLHESVSDLVQSTCRELLAAGPEFDWQGEARFRSWLFTAALNKIRMRLRGLQTKKRAHHRDSGVSLGEVADARGAEQSPSQIAIGHEAADGLQQALDRLPVDHREVIALARLAGLPVPEVARVMGRTENAIRTLLSLALVALSAEMARLDGADDSRD
ncbi:MAG: sigma-70 family RNA polymerase sigma factor [Planctomycetes bacterium]|jgi:RNA polymerase sigma factor (sigma-70 family)|nr:sigma-70 family RNA polymerase sigma factor [Planctomycetota bacterium]